jgi:hypothetical protein
MRRTPRLLTLLATLIVAVLSLPSHAQMGAWRAMAGGMTTPNVNARQLKLYAKLLALSPDQTSAAEALLAGYETEYLAAIKRFQEIQQAANQEFMQSGDMQEVQGAVQDAIKKFNKRTAALETSLMSDLKAILEPAQAEKWPQVERMHRRLSTINWGSISGESVDIADLVEGLRLTPEQAAPIAPLLAQYELDLDRELKTRNALIEEQMKDWLEGGFANFDLEKMKKQASDLREAGRKIYELNKRYAAQVQPLVPSDLQDEFAQKVKLSSHPVVYRQSHADRVLASALKLPDLDASQREALTILSDTHGREAAAINDRWAAAITDNELNPTDDNPFASMMPNRQLPPAIKDAKEARDALDQRTIDAVTALLTETQRAKLPEKKYRPDLDFDAPSPR